MRPALVYKASSKKVRTTQRNPGLNKIKLGIVAIIPAELQRQRPEDYQRFVASLVYIESDRSAKATQ